MFAISSTRRSSDLADATAMIHLSTGQISMASTVTHAPTLSLMGFDTSQVSATAVREAAQRIQHAVTRTPLQPWKRVSAATGARVLIKREDLEPVRSYKVRGAFNLMLRLDEAEQARGVVCASAGNHAQGVALACAELGIGGRMFVPRTTPRQKLDRIATLGAEQVTIVEVGSTYDEASAAARSFAESDGAVMVHPFDDPRTIIGQGTVRSEERRVGEEARSAWC